MGELLDQIYLMAAREPMGELLDQIYLITALVGSIVAWLFRRRRPSADELAEHRARNPTLAHRRL